MQPQPVQCSPGQHCGSAGTQIPGHGRRVYIGLMLYPMQVSIHHSSSCGKHGRSRNQYSAAPANTVAVQDPRYQGRAGVFIPSYYPWPVTATQMFRYHHCDMRGLSTSNFYFYNDGYNSNKKSTLAGGNCHEQQDFGGEPKNDGQGGKLLRTE